MSIHSGRRQSFRLFANVIGLGKIECEDFAVIDDFEVARGMAQRIRRYDYNYFIVVIS